MYLTNKSIKGWHLKYTWGLQWKRVSSWMLKNDDDWDGDATFVVERWLRYVRKPKLLFCYECAVADNLFWILQFITTWPIFEWILAKYPFLYLFACWCRKMLKNNPQPNIKDERKIGQCLNNIMFVARLVILIRALLFITSSGKIDLGNPQKWHRTLIILITDYIICGDLNLISFPEEKCRINQPRSN